MKAQTPLALGVILVLAAAAAAGCSSKKKTADMPPSPTIEAPPPQPPKPPADPPNISLQVETTPPLVKNPCDDIQASFRGNPIRFEVNSSSLGPDARDSVDRVAEALRASGLIAALQLEIDGHCDQTGSEGYNTALGDRRAETVRQRLIQLGVVDAARTQTVSYGEQQPLDPAQTPEAYAKNRRAEISLKAGCSPP